MQMRKYTIADFLEVKASFAGTFTRDASRVIFLSNLTGTVQLYMLDIAGATQLTDFPDPITKYALSRTDRIVFAKAERGDENTQLFELDVETLSVTQLTNAPAVRYNLGQWSYDGRYLSYASNERNGVDFDVYVRDMETGVVRCMFQQGGWCGSAGFSPKGTYLAVSRSNSLVDNDIYLVRLVDGGIEHLTPHAGHALYGPPRWYPEEDTYVMTSNESREFHGLMRSTTGFALREWVLTEDSDIEDAVLDRTGTYLVLGINRDGYADARFYDCKTLQELPLSFPKGDIGHVRFSEDASHVVFNRSDSRHTCDVWSLDITSGDARQLTRSPQGVPADVLAEPELIRFSSFDGLSVPAFVYRPADAVRDTQLPVIVLIHGGPEAQFRPNLSAIVQYFTYAGYMVVAPNVRGSSGYGARYLSLDDVEKRLDALKDIVALRAYLVARADVDPSRIVLMGGSYGGFMVLAGLAFYPELWAAGVDTVGIANFITFLENTAPYRRGLREAEYGSLEHDKEFLKSISPINAVDKIQAPLFVIHGAHDPRVPLAEARQIVDRLTALGRDVELLVYDDEGHGLNKLKNRLDAYPKVVAFLERVLQR